MRTSKTILVVVLFTLFGKLTKGQAQADTLNRELAVKINGIDYKNVNFNNLSFIYKKQKSGNKYARYKVAATGINGNFFIDDYNTNINNNAGCSFAWGREKRKELKSNVLLINGWEAGIAGNIATSATETSDGNLAIGTTLSFRYVLGFQYNLKKNFFINLETTPGVYVGSTINTNGNYSNFRLNYGLNANLVDAAVRVGYKF